VAELCRREGLAPNLYYLYGLVPLCNGATGLASWSACVPVSGVMNRVQRPDGKFARTGLNRW
jgi:hypothetical protein